MSKLPDTETHSARTPDAEVDVTEELVRELLAAQAPDFADMSIKLAATGWDNFTFRLGADYAVRLPRRKIGATLIEREQTWMPKLAPTLSLPTPVPLHVGEPGAGFPWKWSVLPWLPGCAADEEEPQTTEAQKLARFLRELHRPAPDDAPPNPVRGVPLHTRQEGVEARLKRLEQATDIECAPIWRSWGLALSEPVSDARLWLHGDLHARNVLTHEGRISGIIDWGDITAGDPATDLASAWALFGDAGARQDVFESYGADEHLIARAKGWAVLFGAVLLDTGLVDNPRHTLMGLRTLDRVARDA